MMGHNNHPYGRFAALTVDNHAARSVLVRPCRMHHNIHFHEGMQASTSVYETEDQLAAGVIHAARHNNFRYFGIQRPVQAATRGSQPLDLDAHRAPSLLEVLSLPLIDRLDEVERPAIAEVQPCPHAGMVPA